MSTCCNPDDYDRIFTPKEARRDLRRYLAKGLRGSQLDLADAISAIGVEGKSLLEIGSGLGALHVELLQRGATNATSVDLSSSWTQAATDLLAARHLTGRVTRLHGDVLDMTETLDQHDVVVAHRVVCCYPDWQQLVQAVVSRARSVVGLTFPRDVALVRCGLRIGNVFPRLFGLGFRAHVHDPLQMIGLVQSSGFRVLHDHAGVVWRTVVATR